MKRVLIAIAIISVISSCKKGLQEEFIPMDLNVNDIGTITVINAKIEMEGTAWVQVSYSEDINAAFTSSPNYETNAIIHISDGNATEQLTYSDKGIYIGKSILGQVGINYTLTLDINGVAYSATSTMFPPATLRDITLTPYPNEGATSTGKGGSSSGKGGSNYTCYNENWVVNDPSATRNRYLFELWENGTHSSQFDWAIDDNRVVNANEGLSLFNPIRDVCDNVTNVFRVAEIDKSTYDYFNMYEKINGGIASAGDQTPYNPTSSFGSGTIGNFRAVAFSSYILTFVDTTDTSGSDGWKNVNTISGVGEITITWDNYDGADGYVILWKNEPGITGDKNSSENSISDDKNNPVQSPYLHTGLDKNLTYYYKVMALSKNGNPLSEEVSAKPD